MEKYHGDAISIPWRVAPFRRAYTFIIRARHSWIGHGESIARGVAFWGVSRSMTHNLQRPLVRYLSSFAYRLSRTEHSGIIKRRYLFSRRTHEAHEADPLSSNGSLPPSPFPERLARRRGFRRKKCYGVRLRGSCTDCQRDTDRATLRE